jgi:hypothetical protein
MKAKATKPLTAKQLKARDNYDRMSVESTTQPSKQSPKNAQINIQEYLKFNADKLADIIIQIENVIKGLKILASEVKTLK